MSVEADFGLSGFVGQANNTQASWDISWPGVIDQKRFVAVSFQTDFSEAEVVRVSGTGFSTMVTWARRRASQASLGGQAFPSNSQSS